MASKPGHDQSAPPARRLLRAIALGALLPLCARASAMPPLDADPPSLAVAQSRRDLKVLAREAALHLNGQKTASLPELLRRLDEFRASLAAGAMPESEAAGLDARARELAALLREVSATGGNRRVSPRTRAILGSILGAIGAERLEGLSANIRTLRGLTAHPGTAARIFDNQGPSYPASLPAPRGRRHTHAAASRGRIGLNVLFRLSPGPERTAACRMLARDILGALKLKDADGSRSVPLGNFLRDIDDYAPVGFSDARLSVDKRKGFRLVYERAGGARRVIAGRFLPGAAFRGRTSADSLVVTGAIEVDARGEAAQDRPGYWREYAADDARLEWSSRLRREVLGWGPWSRETVLRDVTLRRQAYRVSGGRGRWVTLEEEVKKTLAVEEGRSWFGEAQAEVMSQKHLSGLLDFCGKAGQTIYTGLMGAPQSLAAAATGSPAYSLEAAGSYAKNPFLESLTDDRLKIQRLSPGAREELYGMVRALRRQSLEGQPYPLPPDAMARAVIAPITDQEAARVLRENYGAGTYGERLIAQGMQSAGAAKAGLVAAGVLAGAFESAAESLYNPLVLATFGVGGALQAVRDTQAVAKGARGAALAYRALRLTRDAMTGALMTPWALGAADDIGETVRATARGEFDQRYFNRLGAASSDLFFAALMLKGRPQARAADPAPESKGVGKGFWRQFRDECGRRVSLNPKAGELLAYGTILPYSRLRPAAPAPAAVQLGIDRVEKSGAPAFKDDAQRAAEGDAAQAEPEAHAPEAGPDAADGTRALVSSGMTRNPVPAARRSAEPARAFAGSRSWPSIAGLETAAETGLVGAQPAGGGRKADAGAPKSVKIEPEAPPRISPAKSLPVTAEDGLAAPAGTGPAPAASQPLTVPRSAPPMESGRPVAASLAKQFDGAAPPRTAAALKKQAPLLAGAAGRASAGAAAIPAFSPAGNESDMSRSLPGAAPAAGTQAGAGRSRHPAATGARPAPARAGLPARPWPEDFSHASMPAAPHLYEFPKEGSQHHDDAAFEFLLDLGLRLSAAAAVGYLLLYSNLPYLIGFSRKARLN